ncbi:MAG TPA: IPT/TIG domain-containing protein [Pantanalinema sp.]
MRVALSLIRTALLLSASVALSACASATLPVATLERLEAGVGNTESNVRPEVPPTVTGTLRLSILWPERRDYRTLAIPLRTNAITVQVLDVAEHRLAEAVITRPQAGTWVTTANLTVPAGADRRVVVKAFQEQVPGFDSVPIAQGDVTVTVEPSQEVTADLALVPQTMPEIASIPSSGAPLSTVVITGSGFKGWGQPVEVRFGGSLAPYVSGNETQLTAVVPTQAEDGPITVTADGLTVTSAQGFRVIRALALSPETAVASAGAPIDYLLGATDKLGVPIPNPVVTWFFQQTCPVLSLPGEATPSTLLDGLFTPGSTGSYEIRATAGSLIATASVTVN